MTTATGTWPCPGNQAGPPVRQLDQRSSSAHHRRQVPATRRLARAAATKPEAAAEPITGDMPTRPRRRLAMPAYALAVSDAEAGRYQMMAQHAIAAEAAQLTAAGIVAGATVADIGCGPAAMSIEIARMVGPGRAGHRRGQPPRRPGRPPPPPPAPRGRCPSPPGT